MEALLPASSVLAAFIGGMLALAAPCCVTFLLPAYLAGVYRARVAVLAMTFVFGLGIAAVILPIALGVSALSRAVSQWHSEVFILGGVFLLFLGTWSLMGKNLALPFHARRGATGPGVFSIFGLGVFSGAASSCCAPVLIGVLTLTALTSSLPQASVVATAYVFGMVFPLLVAAYLWERFDLSQSLIFRGRTLELRAGGIRWRIHSTNLIAGILFWVLGILILILTFSGDVTRATEVQTRLSEDLRSIGDAIINWADWVPGAVVALGLVAAAAGLVRVALRRRDTGGSASSRVPDPPARKSTAATGLVSSGKGRHESRSGTFKPRE